MNGRAKVIPCAEKYAVYEEKKELFKTDDATVEVTIKLKKRQKSKPRSQKSQLSQAYNAETAAHRAGSWGDLLMRKKIVAESQMSNAGDQAQEKALPSKIRPKDSQHNMYQYNKGKPPRSEMGTAGTGKMVHAQVGYGFRDEYDDVEPKTLYHRKKSKYTKAPSLHHNHPSEPSGVLPNAPCTHLEKYQYSKEYRHDLGHCHGPGTVQFQVPQSQQLNKAACTILESKCCDACTCFTVNSRLKDQESQTSMLAQQTSIATATPSAVSVATTTTQTTLKSPPTKEIEIQVPQQKIPFEQQRTQNMNGHIKPKHSNSSPEKNNFRRVSSSRRSETTVSTTVATSTTASRRKEESQVQLQYGPRDGQRSNGTTVTGTGKPISSTITSRARTEDETDQEGILQNLKKLSDLEIENFKLKKDTAVLLHQVDKAKTERQEYITTIKELYELAEVLRHENVILIGNHEEHRTLEDKLVEAIGENQVLKQHLQELTTKLPPPPAAPLSTEAQDQPVDNHNQSHIKDFWRVRDILKEVKTVIADEIHGLQNISLRKSPNRIDDSDILSLFEKMGPHTGSNFNMNLNDTNGQCDEEVQHILNISRDAADRSDVRSSTQYLDLGVSETKRSARNFVPSPCSDISSL